MTERKSRVPASPKVRKFARELGLDINQIIGSKREGRVIENDVKIGKTDTLITDTITLPMAYVS